MKTFHVATVDGSRVVPFLAKAWTALMDDGQWSKTEVLVSGDLQCVYAVDGRDIVGCLSYHIDEGVGAVINIAYVLPDYRGRGVYRLLHRAFARKAKAEGATCAINICYPTNTSIQAACKKLGYGLYTQEWRMKL